MEYKKIFDNKAIIYDKYRPSYATGLIQYLLDNNIILPEYTVADIGCGTGILSRQLCDYVSKIYGIEPSQNMLVVATNSFSTNDKFVPINSSAEETTLNDSCIDFISVGQAFHWFNPVLFRKEACRILKKGGFVMLVWNKKNDCILEQERLSIVNKYRTTKDVYDCSWEKRMTGIDRFFNEKYSKLSFQNDIKNTKEEFIMRTLSASHALEQNSPNINVYIREWEDYFDKYCENGIITIPNTTLAYIGTITN